MVYFLSRIWSISYYANEMKVIWIPSFETQELISIPKWDQTFEHSAPVNIVISKNDQFQGFQEGVFWDLDENLNFKIPLTTIKGIFIDIFHCLS